ncbi:MAG: DegV family protein, partial [Anaerolineales bacterium]
LQAMKGAMHTFFVVDTLEYLLQGGRIGRASHLVGSLLDIKPILTLADGVVESHSKARTRRRSLQRMRELVLERVQGLERDKYQLHLGVAHALCEQEARFLTESLEAAIEPDRLLFTTNGPAIGVHAGPGSLAVSWTFFQI